MVHKLKAGTYYIGDLCYVLNKENGWDWSELCHITQDFGSENGAHIFVVNGHRFCSFNTMYGDGAYFDNKGNKYDVDSGSIGAIPVEMLPEEFNSSGGQVFDMKSDFKVQNIDGRLVFGRVKIETASSFSFDTEHDSWGEY